MLQIPIPKRYHLLTVFLFSTFFLGNILSPVLFPHREPKNIQEVMYQHRHFPKAKKAFKALEEQSPEKLRFICYQGRGNAVKELEFAFHFSSEHEVEIIRSKKEFEELASSQEPIIFYITKKRFSTIDFKLHKKLKIVYTFGEHLFATNQMHLIPVFDIAESK